MKETKGKYMANYECENTAHEHGANNFFQCPLHPISLSQPIVFNLHEDPRMTVHPCV